MKLSAPLYHLKRKAKLLSRAENIPLHEALDRVARQEGFGGWSLLAAKATATAPAEKLFARLAPGDLVLVGAPGPGQNPDEPRTRRASHEVRQSRRVLHVGIYGEGHAGSFPRHRRGAGGFCRSV